MRRSLLWVMLFFILYLTPVAIYAYARPRPPQELSFTLMWELPTASAALQLSYINFVGAQLLACPHHHGLIAWLQKQPWAFFIPSYNEPPPNNATLVKPITLTEEHTYLFWGSVNALAGSYCSVRLTFTGMTLQTPNASITTQQAHFLHYPLQLSAHYLGHLILQQPTEIRVIVQPHMSLATYSQTPTSPIPTINAAISHIPTKFTHIVY